MKKLKFLFLSLFLTGLLVPAISVYAQQTTTFIFIRHAEKADDGTEDPPLNEIGKERAKALANHLKEANITAIYSTPYKRTMQTVQPIAEARELKIKMYDPADSSALDKIMEAEADGTVLIAGHSNTTPMLVNQLIGQKKYEQLDESDYNNIFIVTADEVGKGVVVKLTF